MDNKHIFDFEDGNLTKKQKEYLFDVNWTLEDCEEQVVFAVDDNKKYPRPKLEEEGNLFLKGIYDYFNNDLNMHIDDNKSLIQEIRKKYKEKGIYEDEDFSNRFKTIENWINKSGDIGFLPSRGQKYKENSYLFCYALDMDLQKTAEFLFKRFRIMPFNYKNRIDAIYFYCIRMGKDYKTIQELKEKVLALPATNLSLVHTQFLGESILDIENDDEFLDFISKYCYDTEYQFETAKNIIEQLIEKDKQLANSSSGKKDVRGYDGLLYEITGFSHNNRGTKDEKSCGLFKGMFPPDFTDSFPEVYSSKLVSKMSSEGIRKLLILLFFYNFYKNAELADERNNNSSKRDDKEIIKDRIKDFLVDIHNILSDCGFVDLYICNFFDWYILNSITSPKPISMLKNQIYTEYGMDCDEE